jgi:hypothetical protein
MVQYLQFRILKFPLISFPIQGRDDAQFSSAILWEPVPFLPSHWIVNLGTDLFRWTQQRSAEANGGAKGCKPSKATLHRVIPMGIPGCPKGNGKGLERYSMPFFYEANLDTPDPCFPYKKRTGGTMLDTSDLTFFALIQDAYRDCWERKPLVYFRDFPGIWKRLRICLTGSLEVWALCFGRQVRIFD